jgi:hypothetical protein
MLWRWFHIEWDGPLTSGWRHYLAGGIWVTVDGTTSVVNDDGTVTLNGWTLG